MNTSQVEPVVETARLLGIKYSMPNPPKDNSYAVLSFEKDQTITIVKK